MTEREKHWVTSYKLQIRLDHGKQWIEMGTFGGNVDRYTERVHSVDCMPAPYYRFIPQGFVGSHSGQIGLFNLASPKPQCRDTSLNYHVVYPSKRRFLTQDYSSSKRIEKLPKLKKQRDYHYQIKLAQNGD